MKRIILALIIGSSTFAVGVSFGKLRFFYGRPPALKVERTQGVPYCPVPNDLQQILDVEFCDLMRDPERYDGRIVRFKAVMLADPAYEPLYDHVSLGEPRCEPLLMVHDQFHLTSRTCRDVMKTLDALLMRDDPSYPRKNAKVTIVGRFISPKWTVLKTGQDHFESERFALIAIERAASVDEDD